MNDTLLGIIIGGAMTMLPTLFNTWLSHRDHQNQRDHELRMKKYDSIIVPNIDTILRFCEALGNCISIKVNSKALTEDQVKWMQNYYSAYERAYPYVSPQTREAMEAVGDPFDNDVTDKEIIQLNTCLGNELRNAIDQAISPTGKRQQKRLDRDSSDNQGRLASFAVSLVNVNPSSPVHNVNDGDAQDP